MQAVDPTSSINLEVSLWRLLLLKPEVSVDQLRQSGSKASESKDKLKPEKIDCTLPVPHDV